MLVVADQIIGTAWIKHGETGEPLLDSPHVRPHSLIGHALGFAREPLLERATNRLSDRLASGVGEGAGEPVCFGVFDAEGYESLRIYFLLSIYTSEPPRQSLHHGQTNPERVGTPFTTQPPVRFRVPRFVVTDPVNSVIGFCSVAVAPTDTFI